MRVLLLLLAALLLFAVVRGFDSWVLQPQRQLQQHAREWERDRLNEATACERSGGIPVVVPNRLHVQCAARQEVR